MIAALIDALQELLVYVALPAGIAAIAATLMEREA